MKQLSLMIAMTVLSLGLSGCSRGGPATVHRDLPAEIAGLFPPGATIRHEEGTDSGMHYHLWILQAERGDLLSFPKTWKGLDHHDLPGEILVGLFKAKAPTPGVEGLQGRTCRFTHWSAGDLEYQVREGLTDAGWFATIEQVRK